jgi:hypothetical protein
MAFRLFGICSHDAQRHALPDGATVLAMRDLGAIVADAPYGAETPDDEAVAAHHRVIEAAFSHGEVLPMPPGTIFRNEVALQRWVELHYVTLSDALTFVSDRVGARVHIAGVDREGDEVDSGTGLSAAAAEVMRTLRRHAVAGVPLRREHTTGMILGAAFLVERTLWGDFEQQVERLREGDDRTHLTLTGPWPPYDFVRVDFGS